MQPAHPSPASTTRLPGQLLRFVTVGAVTTAVQYAVLWLGVSVLTTPAALASAAGYALGVLLSYGLNYLYTFGSGQSHLDAAPKYFTVFGIGWCINIALMGLLVHRFGWNTWLAQILTTGVGLAWNFSGSRWWTFRQTPG